MFASTTAEHFEGTVEYGDCRLHGDECYGCAFAEPDREVPYVQHNAPNRALVHFRQMHGGKSARDLHNAAVHWVGSLMQMSLAGCYSVFEAKHARRVLERLAALTAVA